MNENRAYVCPRCGIGNCQPGKMTYTRIYKGHLISVPNMIRYRCDVCGFSEFDQDAVNHLYVMLGNSILAKRGKRALKTQPIEPPDAGKTPRPKP